MLSSKGCLYTLDLNGDGLEDGAPSQRWVKEERERRKRLKVEQREAFQRLRKLVNRHDPLGLLECGCPDDEYEPEVGTLLPRLQEADSEEHLLAIIYEEFVRWFGSTADPLDRYRSLAVEIWSVFELEERV